MSDSDTVFVIDDDPSVRSALKRLVASVGLRCETFMSADDFLREVHSVSAGCLVLDVRMPGASGLDLQSQLARDGYLPTHHLPDGTRRRPDECSRDEGRGR